MDLEPLLTQIVQLDASDLYLKTESIPMARVHGKLEPLGDKAVTDAQMEKVVKSIVDEHHYNAFMAQMEYNFAHNSESGERFRVNLYLQRGKMGLVFRRVKLNIPSIRDLRLPEHLEQVALSSRGLFLVTGATGTGKSTTLAAMIEHRNNTQSGHIITIEDPIEYLFNDKKSVISQREVGLDTLAFKNALKNALRQAPDVISIGEMRDLDTAETALVMAETGHFVLATLHATNTYQSLERLTSMFTSSKEKQLLLMLSMNLNGILSQRLVPLKDGSGRIVVTELLICTPRVRELLRNNQISELKEVLRRGEQEGMYSFDQSIHDVYSKGLISREDAISFADSESEMMMKMKGFAGALKQV